jgi:purine-binding chemotaxis protein CheW
MLSTTTSVELHVCTLLVGDLLLGLPLEAVSEVVPAQVLTPVPLADPAVVGLFNLRGRVVTAVDARTRLGMPARSEDTHGVHVVVTDRGETSSLVVDRTSDVLTLLDAEREAVPETVPVPIRRLMTAAYQRPHGLLLLLDLTLTLSLA